MWRVAAVFFACVSASGLDRFSSLLAPARAPATPVRVVEPQEAVAVWKLRCEIPQEVDATIARLKAARSNIYSVMYDWTIGRGCNTRYFGLVVQLQTRYNGIKAGADFGPALDIPEYEEELIKLQQFLRSHQISLRISRAFCAEVDVLQVNAKNLVGFAFASFSLSAVLGVQEPELQHPRLWLLERFASESISRKANKPFSKFATLAEHLWTTDPTVQVLKTPATVGLSIDQTLESVEAALRGFNEAKRRLISLTLANDGQHAEFAAAFDQARQVSASLRDAIAVIRSGEQTAAALDLSAVQTMAASLPVFRFLRWQLLLEYVVNQSPSQSELIPMQTALEKLAIDAEDYVDAVRDFLVQTPVFLKQPTLQIITATVANHCQSKLPEIVRAVEVLHTQTLVLHHTAEPTSFDLTEVLGLKQTPGNLEKIRLELLAEFAEALAGRSCGGPALATKKRQLAQHVLKTEAALVALSRASSGHVSLDKLEYLLDSLTESVAALSETRRSLIAGALRGFSDEADALLESLDQLPLVSEALRSAFRFLEDPGEDQATCDVGAVQRLATLPVFRAAKWSVYLGYVTRYAPDFPAMERVIKATRDARDANVIQASLREFLLDAPIFEEDSNLELIARELAADWQRLTPPLPRPRVEKPELEDLGTLSSLGALRDKLKEQHDATEQVTKRSRQAMEYLVHENVRRRLSGNGERPLLVDDGEWQEFWEFAERRDAAEAYLLKAVSPEGEDEKLIVDILKRRVKHLQQARVWTDVQVVNWGVWAAVAAEVEELQGLLEEATWIPKFERLSLEYDVQISEASHQANIASLQNLLNAYVEFYLGETNALRTPLTGLETEREQLRGYADEDAVLETGLNANCYVLYRERRGLLEAGLLRGPATAIELAFMDASQAVLTGQRDANLQRTFQAVSLSLEFENEVGKAGKTGCDLADLPEFWSVYRQLGSRARQPAYFARLQRLVNGAETLAGATSLSIAKMKEELGKITDAHTTLFPVRGQDAGSTIRRVKGKLDDKLAELDRGRQAEQRLRIQREEEQKIARQAKEEKERREREERQRQKLIEDAKLRREQEARAKAEADREAQKKMREKDQLRDSGQRPYTYERPKTNSGRSEPDSYSPRKPAAQAKFPKSKKY